MFSSRFKQIFLLYLLSINYIKIKSTGCTYKKSSADTEYKNTDNDGEVDKATCWSYSFTVEADEQKCCYNKSTKKCEAKTINDESSGDLECPDESTIINRCGSAGVAVPFEASLCTKISLIESYCCYVEVKKKSDGTKTAACLRSSDQEDEEDEPTDDIAEQLSEYPEYEFVRNDCRGTMVGLSVVGAVAAVVGVIFG